MMMLIKIIRQYNVCESKVIMLLHQFVTLFYNMCGVPDYTTV